MNTSINVTGMQVKTKVSSNLMIATANAEANYSTNDLEQSRAALLEPASSVNGVNFFWHGNSKLDAAGKPTDASATYTAYNENTTLANTYADKTAADYAFNANYGIVGTETPAGSGTDAEKWASTVSASNKSGLVAPAYAYVDYTFYLKATSSENDAHIYLTKLNLLYNSAALTANDASWRVALFTEEVAQDAAGSAVGSMTLVSIYSISGATYYTSGKAASAENAQDTVTPLNQAGVVEDDIDLGVTQRYKVVVRLWLEGEDSKCSNDTYASLTEAWTLGLEFKLDTSSTAVTNIGSAA